MVSVPLNEPERERTRRKDAELFEATPEQIPPQNLEAEEMILGGILLDPDAIGRVADVLQPEAFYTGYARNFLLPHGKALPVTPAVLKQVEHRRAKEAERLAALKADAVAFRTALDTIGRFTVKKQTGGDDVLFGTVTNVDVAEAIESATKKLVDKRDITVPEVHRTGNYKVQVKLHPDCLLYTSPSPRDMRRSRMPSSA